jgi:hypothetical protein
MLDNINVIDPKMFVFLEKAGLEQFAEPKEQT